MKLPDPISLAVRPLFEALPLDRALTRLVVVDGPSAELRRVVEALLKDPVIAARAPLQSALWLYVDALDLSHTISQGIETPTGSFWHGIMHRREGDFSNSHYWFNRTGRHPAMATIAGYDAHTFVDEVAAQHAAAPAALVDRQRREWVALFEWCAAQS